MFFEPDLFLNEGHGFHNALMSYVCYFCHSFLSALGSAIWCPL